MIAPFLFALLMGSRRVKPKTPDSVVLYEPLCHIDNELTVSALAPYAYGVVTVAENSEKAALVKGLVLSASGLAKFRLIKNGSVLATLFSTKEHRNVFYPYNVSIAKGDSLAVECLNRDSLSQDMYVGFDAEEVCSN